MEEKLPNIYSVIRKEHFEPPEIHLFRYEKDARNFILADANLTGIISYRDVIGFVYHGDTNPALDELWERIKRDGSLVDVYGIYYGFEEQEVWEG